MELRSKWDIGEVCSYSRKNVTKKIENWKSVFFSQNPSAITPMSEVKSFIARALTINCLHQTWSPSPNRSPPTARHPPAIHPPPTRHPPSPTYPILWGIKRWVLNHTLKIWHYFWPHPPPTRHPPTTHPPSPIHTIMRGIKRLVLNHTIQIKTHLLIPHKRG